jgi:hypothetical protein
MRIIRNGNVGIGVTAPADKLEVSGTVRATGYRTRSGSAGAYGGNVFNITWDGVATANLYIDAASVGAISLVSDRRLKENIGMMKGNALERVMSLRPVEYNFKKIEGTIFSGSKDRIEGFIADELKAVIPSAVNGERDALTKDGTVQPQTVNLAPVVSVLTKAIQEQQLLIDSLKLQNEKILIEMKEIKEKLNTAEPKK